MKFIFKSRLRMILYSLLIASERFNISVYVTTDNSMQVSVTLRGAMETRCAHTDSFSYFCGRDTKTRYVIAKVTSPKTKVCEILVEGYIYQTTKQEGKGNTVYTYTRAHTHTRTHTRMHAYTHTRVYVCVCACVCVCVCVCFSLSFFFFFWLYYFVYFDPNNYKFKKKNPAIF